MEQLGVKQQPKQVFQHLKFVAFKDLTLWDVKRLFIERTQSNYSTATLGQYIQEESTKIKPSENPEKEHFILGVNNQVGVFDAYVQHGKEIKQPYKVMKSGYLAYNPYRINVGSIGIKTDEHQHNLISPAYVVFSCKNQLKPEFLFRLFKTNRFNQVIRESTTGSVRQNLTYRILQSLQVPLPSLPEQEKILARYKDKIAEAEQLEQELATFIDRYQNILFKHLGIEIIQAKQVKNKLHIVNFKDISRWDVLYLSGALPSIQSKYQLIKFSNVILCLNSNYGKSIRINSSSFPDNEFQYIGMEHIEKGTGELLEAIKVKGKQIKSHSISIPKGFLLYGKLRPYLNKYWVNDKVDDNLICSAEFLVFNIDQTKVNKTFFKFILSSSIVQTQISDKPSGARMPRINEKVFMELEFPLPPLSIQRRIVKELEALVAKRKAKQAQAEQLRQQAQQEFEQNIFLPSEAN